MNYIKRLQTEAKTMQHLRNEADEALTEFLVYICSEKFWNDPTIQVTDVLQWLKPIRKALTAMKSAKPVKKMKGENKK